MYCDVVCSSPRLCVVCVLRYLYYDKEKSISIPFLIHPASFSLLSLSTVFFPLHPPVPHSLHLSLSHLSSLSQSPLFFLLPTLVLCFQLLPTFPLLFPLYPSFPSFPLPSPLPPSSPLTLLSSIHYLTLLPTPIFF